MSDFATAQLGPALTRLALCWRVVRGDGVALGFTTHDAALNIDGLSYASAPGMAKCSRTNSPAMSPVSQAGCTQAAYSSCSRSKKAAR